MHTVKMTLLYHVPCTHIDIISRNYFGLYSIFCVYSRHKYFVFLMPPQMSPHSSYKLHDYMITVCSPVNRGSCIVVRILQYCNDNAAVCILGSFS